jgi:hypothetical protein
VNDRVFDSLVSLYMTWCSDQGFSDDQISCADEMLSSRSPQLNPHQRKWLEAFSALWEIHVDEVR